MGEAYRKIFWGIFILTLHINLGPLQILPNFVGYFLMASASTMLFDRHGISSFRNAKHMAAVLGVLSLLESLYFFMGQVAFAPYTFFGPLLFGVLELLFFYQVLGGYAFSLENDGHQEEGERTRSLQRKVTVLLAVQTGLYFAASVLYLTSFLSFLVLFFILMRIYLMSIFAQLRRDEDGKGLEVREAEEESYPMNQG